MPLERFTPLTFTALKTASPPPEAAHGHELVFVGRRGKHLLLDFGEVTFVVHLMQGGRLKPDEKQSAKPRNGQARWRFADGRALLLTEAGTERKAGVWVVDGDPEEQAPLVGLGPEADTVDKATLAQLLKEQLDAAARVPPRPAPHRGHGPAARQRGVPPRPAVAVREHRQARHATTSTSSSRRSTCASTRAWPSSAASTR